MAAPLFLTLFYPAALTLCLVCVSICVKRKLFAIAPLINGGCGMRQHSASERATYKGLICCVSGIAAVALAQSMLIGNTCYPSACT